MKPKTVSTGGVGDDEDKDFAATSSTHGHLDAAQIDAIRTWKDAFRTPDRLRMLKTLNATLSGGGENAGGKEETNPFFDGGGKSGRGGGGGVKVPHDDERNEQSIFRKDNFALRLKPKMPPPVD